MELQRVALAHMNSSGRQVEVHASLRQLLPTSMLPRGGAGQHHPGCGHLAVAVLGGSGRLECCRLRIY
jgi:hypothetical protein